ncbi:MAG: 50S ribosomal protein L18 [Candidatus Pacebacteria bacterium]|nr:50S ribosomal protein L18 [Candidatus Paceibacterota bacterium]PIR64048.1 MAG: 50S ribosomal protein L18 [Candidatus Pacebacteria bacterium CG10_big_fil_rev_8_21_14_0_10_40_26]PIZ78152.1 MAG: 50S ribosomal protein L18 [Candidatus Pacebacteria bacterium CG_4_10_14_0_2_um_filter_40_20]PJA69124.1 MAG: 50S ribosomal protein L18 [Candidatus Pacebacteria bacterium CG_4_9_14_3_um_filter_40_12]PJC41743.1 MAG: 50S ribosomal protein L18 [Candidatus Pacebacteria bacterium CG_4_9_14_0_2_um_filter_40_15]
MPTIKHNKSTQQKRKMRVRTKLHGTAARPRVSVERTNKYIYIQAINDDAGLTLASASDAALRKSGKDAGTKTETAAIAASELAAALKKQKISTVVFDRGQYKYHGRVSKVAEILREKGIEV